MVFRGVCFAYYVCVGAAMAAPADDRAREMAECGYLAHMAVQQMKKLDERPAVYDEVVTDVIDFINLYYHHSDLDRPVKDGRINGEMLFVAVSAGKEIHDARTRAMSPKNALRLSNTVLNRCRTDLHLFAKKLEHR